jgi:type II secretory pathway pseudopilin PulG
MIKKKQINRKHKKAFSMITAIFVIVIMATVSALIMNITGKTVKATTQQYQKEQAQLLARSYTELAILYAIHYDRTTTPNCLETITDHFGVAGNNGYDIRMNIKYLGNDALLDGCSKTILANGTVGIASNAANRATWVDDAAVNGGINNTISLIIDTYITYRDFDDPNSRDITFHRRTLQKL